MPKCSSFMSKPSWSTLFNTLELSKSRGGKNVEPGHLVPAGNGKTRGKPKGKREKKNEEKKKEEEKRGKRMRTE